MLSGPGEMADLTWTCCNRMCVRYLNTGGEVTRGPSSRTTACMEAMACNLCQGWQACCRRSCTASRSAAIPCPVSSCTASNLSEIPKAGSKSGRWCSCTGSSSAAGPYRMSNNRAHIVLTPGIIMAMYPLTWSQSTLLCATCITASWVLRTGTSGSRGSVSSLASSMIWTTDRIVVSLMRLSMSADNHV